MAVIRSGLSEDELNALLFQALILWPRRIREGLSSLTFDDAHRLDFNVHLHRTFNYRGEGELSWTDLDFWLREILATHRTLFGWYTLLFERSGVRIDWIDGGPLVPISMVTEWTRLVSRFDSDVLLTFDWARRKIGGEGRFEARSLPAWATAARASDAELRGLWRRGLSDMHIHVGGVRLPHETWLDLLLESRRSAQLDTLRKSYQTEDCDLEQDIKAARNLRKRLADSLGAPSRYELRRVQPHGERWSTWNVARLASERTLLADAWCALREPGHGAAERIAPLFDAYLEIKHRFHILTHQPAFQDPRGLRAFDQRRFSALKARKPRGKQFILSEEYGASQRLRMGDTANACEYLLESPDLCRIELRIGPFDYAHEYWRHFGAWRRLEQQLRHGWQRNDRKAVEIRFAVHFKRSESRRRPGQTNTDFQLRQLDSQSAALRIALARSDNPDVVDRMKALVRIDVAGQERDTHCGLFGFHLRLLRGDQDALRELEDGIAPHPTRAYLVHWHRLRERGIHRPSAHERRLGLTVHAGEDAADLLDGLYQVAAALHVCRLQAGDGIGHALALTSKADFAPLARVQQGVRLDSLCWLHDLLSRHPGAWTGLEVEQLHLEHRISAVGRSIYDMDGKPSGTAAEEFVELWRSRFYGRNGEEARHSSWWRHLQARDGLQDVIRNREKMIALNDRTLVPGAIAKARALLLDEVKRRRVVVEMNPSSNLRISGADATELSPTIEIFKEAGNGLLACVNTDNPGVFATCVENEYALLVDGARRAQMPEGDIRDLVERVRRIGIEVLL